MDEDDRVEQLRSVNLLPREIVTRRARDVVLRAWIASLCLAAGAVAMGTIIVRAPAMLAGVGLEHAAKNVKVKIKGIEGELPGLNEQLGVVDRRLRMLDTLEDRPDWGILLAYLYDHRGQGVAIERLELFWSPEGGMTFSLTGLGDSPGRERSLVVGLESSGLFSSTTLLETRRESSAGGDRIVFEIESRFEPAVAEASSP